MLPAAPGSPAGWAIPGIPAISDPLDPLAVPSCGEPEGAAGTDTAIPSTNSTGTQDASSQPRESGRRGAAVIGRSFPERARRRGRRAGRGRSVPLQQETRDGRRDNRKHAAVRNLPLSGPRKAVTISRAVAATPPNSGAIRLATPWPDNSRSAPQPAHGRTDTPPSAGTRPHGPAAARCAVTAAASSR
ncbi:hypothetical protein GCM10018790_13300 [Kitasatospora xanthocidica]|nr:hypothetical protein GCM10018790_13300 [Kitasatospora xanthocidica]